jgi:hypothetical protein
MSKKQVWVSPNPGGGWKVHNSNSARDTAHVNNKTEAVEVAREIARNQQAELRIQNKDGKIAECNSYGRDPFPPKG